MTKPHGRYDFTTTLDALIYGIADKTVTIARDVECEVDVFCDVSANGELTVYCTNVFIDGDDLQDGNFFASAVNNHIKAKANEALEMDTPLFDQVKEAEGLVFIGHPSDPDASWTIGG